MRRSASDGNHESIRLNAFLEGPFSVTVLFGEMKFTLAVRNLLRSGGRLWVSLFGIVFATFLMGLQGSLLFSFTRAASRIVDAVSAPSRCCQRYADLRLRLTHSGALRHASAGR